jgi:hypothetical protein
MRVCGVRADRQNEAPSESRDITSFNWEESMHAVLRTYSGKGAKELFDIIEKNKTDVEKVLRSVKGFVAYSIARSSDGGFSMTVCQDKAGAEESNAKAKDWIKHNAPKTGVGAPAITEGSVILHLQ